MLSLCEPKFFEKEDGSREKRRDVLVPSSVFLREKLKEGRRLESVLGRGPDDPIELSFDIAAGIDVGGYLFCLRSSPGWL
jgi:hypothetical protein